MDNEVWVFTRPPIVCNVALPPWRGRRGTMRYAAPEQSPAEVKEPPTLANEVPWVERCYPTVYLYRDLPAKSSQYGMLRPTKLDKSRTFMLRFTLALQLVLRREPRPARSGPRQASFPCPHQPARADYSPSCQADMAAIRPPLTVSGASQASLRHTLQPPSVSGPAASWRLLPLLPAGTAAAAVPVNCASPGLPCLYAPARSVVIVTPGDKLTQYWYTKGLE